MKKLVITYTSKMTGLSLPSLLALNGPPSYEAEGMALSLSYRVI